MSFWHWTRYVDAKKKTIAKRAHGLALHPRWDGVGEVPLHQSPRLQGSPALGTTHPFHFEMTPSMLLRPCCNHGLGVLLRFYKRVNETRDSGDIQPLTAIASMLDAMGDHEHFSAAYSAKDQPHVEGSFLTLAESLRAKEQNIATARSEGKEFTAHEISRNIFHKLIAATNRHMQKGFPDMLTYLLGKPMEYCSHRFVPLSVDLLFRIAIASVYSRLVLADVVPATQHFDNSMQIQETPRIRINICLSTTGV